MKVEFREFYTKDEGTVILRTDNIAGACANKGEDADGFPTVLTLTNGATYEVSRGLSWVCDYLNTGK